jgi:hypothetical protein
MTSADADPTRELLRHIVATLAYRGGKSIRDAPADFASFLGGETAQTPLKILSHMADLLEWACSIAEGQQRWPKSAARTWEQEADRFFAGLTRFDAHLASAKPLAAPAEKLFQGPVADALTHVGQMAMLRRMAGSPIRGENYYLADMTVGRVGPDQAPARREFD